MTTLTSRSTENTRRSRLDAPARDPMQEFANRILAELENGVKPWVRPWDPEKADGPQAPFNPVTGARYHGINVLILGMDLRAFQSGDPRWMTYQQAQGKDWQVKKGERSTTIFFTKPYELEDDDADGGRKIIRVLTHYAVFHASQIEGVPAYQAPRCREEKGRGRLADPALGRYECDCRHGSPPPESSGVAGYQIAFRIQEAIRLASEGPRASHGIQNDTGKLPGFLWDSSGYREAFGRLSDIGKQPIYEALQWDRAEVCGSNQRQTGARFAREEGRGLER